jgi:hypothetical protein
MPALVSRRGSSRMLKNSGLNEATLSADKVPAGTRVVIVPFSTTDEDITTGDKKEVE